MPPVLDPATSAISDDPGILRDSRVPEWGALIELCPTAPDLPEHIHCLGHFRDRPRPSHVRARLNRCTPLIGFSFVSD